jgi:hypothetical protein
MNLSKIQSAVRAGKTVHWASTGYKIVLTILRDGTEQWLIGYNVGGRGENYIGLTWRDGVTLNGKPEEFFIGA